MLFFLCLKCAGVHRGFGVSVSFIKSLNMDSWSEDQIKQLSFGGNQRLRNLFKEYSIPENTDADFKYFLVATDYYRKLLKAEIAEQNPPIKPTLNEGLDIISIHSNDNQYENYKPVSNNDFNVYPDKPKEKKRVF